MLREGGPRLEKYIYSSYYLEGESKLPDRHINASPQL